MKAADPRSPRLAIHLFGPFEARVSGDALPRLRTRRSEWLLALLALRAGQAVERGWLAGTLWPDSSAGQALSNLRGSLTDLRRALGAAAGCVCAPSPRSLALDLPAVDVDLIAFDRAIARGDAASLEAAAALYRGPLLEGCCEEWAFQERQAREQAYLAARERLAALAFEGDEAADAERHLRLAVAIDPLRESTQRALMQVLAAGGNYAAALHCYRELRLHLHRELNIEPDTETQTLFAELRREARRLATKGGMGMSRWRGNPDRETERLDNTNATFAPSLSPPFSRSPRPAPELPAAVLREALSRAPVVGREAELAALARRLATAGEGRGSVCLLAGEPGIGKTRLATEAVALARQRGFLVLTGRCDETAAAPYQPFVEALRQYLDRASREQAEATLPPPVAGELVRLAPRLTEKVTEVPPVAPAMGAAGRQALGEALGEFFALLTGRQSPVLLVLDDLHWADEGSLAMLHLLARRAPGLPLLVVGTYRDLPPDWQPPLEQTLAALHRERLSERLPLRRLPEAGVAEMVAGLLAEPCEPEDEPERRVPAALITALYQETEGNPFFLEEVLQHLVEEGAISRRDGHWQMALPRPEGTRFRVPPSVQAAIGRRLALLAAASREALRLAAAIGLQFDFEVLLEASGVEEERLVGWVEEWLGARLVVEERGGREEVYQFQHALIRAALYGGVSRRRQGHLHERVGWALETVYVQDREEPLEELARHFARARSGSAREKGLEYCLRAGEKALGLSADAAAIQQFRSALRLLDGFPEDEAHWKLRWQAVDRLAQAHRVRLEWEPARQVVEEYLARAERVGRPWGIASAHWGVAYRIHMEIYVRNQGDIELGRRHAETSLALCEREGLTDLLPQVSVLLAEFLMGEPGSDLPRAAALLRQMLDEGVHSGRPEVQWWYGLLAGIYARLGKWDETMAIVRESIAAGGVPTHGVAGLGPLEEGMDAQGRQAEFMAFCDDCRRLLARTGAADPLAHWYLAPAQPCVRFSQVAFQDDFAGPSLREEWQWCDPLQVSAYRLGERAGCVTLHAADGTDLHPVTGFNAPRLLLEVRGEFALEARMEGDWDQRNQIGSSGLLVWKDPRNYLRLEKFCMSIRSFGSVQLDAMVHGEYRVVGRGLLRGSAFHLRLEREGERFTALCSADGIHWLTCGQVALPARDPLLVGIASLRGVVAHFDWVRVLTKP